MTSLDLIRGLYDYHRWANRRLFDVAAALEPAILTRDLGAHWSVATLTGMFAHLCGADALWLARWRGTSPARAEMPDLAAVRRVWDGVEADQRAFLDGLAEADLARPVTYRNAEGASLSLALGPSLQHVANHATHHRSEIATMLTLTSGSPPDTGIATYQTAVAGRPAAGGRTAAVRG